MANVVIKSGDTIVQGGATDFDGNYNISPLSPGVYTVEVSFIGFETETILNVEIAISKLTILNFKLTDDGENHITICGVNTNPLINPFFTGATYSSEDINEMPIMR